MRVRILHWNHRLLEVVAIEMAFVKGLSERSGYTFRMQHYDHEHGQ